MQFLEAANRQVTYVKTNRRQSTESVSQSVVVNPKLTPGLSSRHPDQSIRKPRPELRRALQVARQVSRTRVPSFHPSTPSSVAHHTLLLADGGDGQLPFSSRCGRAGTLPPRPGCPGCPFRLPRGPREAPTGASGPAWFGVQESYHLSKYLSPPATNAGEKRPVQGRTSVL